MASSSTSPTRLNLFNIEKLKGQENYEVWKLRILAALEQADQIKAIQPNTRNLDNSLSLNVLAIIKLLVEDGPLVQIQYCITAKEAWDLLENLYSPKGFISEYLICKEFFTLNLNNFSNIEEYLNRVKQLVNLLKAKNILIPTQLIVAYILNNLNSNYEGFTSTIIQSYRDDSQNINLEILFSNLIDESRRIKSLESSNSTLFTKDRNTKAKNFKVSKKVQKFCTKCKNNSHLTKDCYYLFPNKAPKGWKGKRNFKENTREASYYINSNKATSKKS